MKQKEVPVRGGEATIRKDCMGKVTFELTRDSPGRKGRRRNWFAKAQGIRNPGVFTDL